MEVHPPVGVGVGDYQHALRGEIAVIAKRTKGSPLAQTKILYDRLKDLDLITDSEVRELTRLADNTGRASAGKKNAKTAYFESRKIYDGLLASGTATPLALVIASSSVGSFKVEEDQDGTVTVVYAKNDGDWEKRGAAIGGIIGAGWGPGGAALGGFIGGAIGHAVDECVD